MAPQEQALEFETYYNAVMDMLSSDGWKYLISDLTKNSVNINAVEFTKDAEDLYFRKGQLNVMANLLNLGEQLEILRKQQDEEAATLEQEESN